MSDIFLIAGEESGDRLGGSLLHALRKRPGGSGLTVSGVGGASMAHAGLESRFPMTELSVMGLAEVLPRVPALLRRIRETADAIIATRPRVVVTIDAPDFCFRVAKRVKARAPDIPIVHLVAPTVWAWRPGRARNVAKFLDHMLCLLPFEPPYFEREGLAATFIGHPVVEDWQTPGDPAGFRSTYGIPQDAPVLAFLPGSRRGEVSRHLPVFTPAVAHVADRVPGLQVVSATRPHVADTVRESLSHLPCPVHVIDGASAEKRDAFRAATAALAASGTVSVELALAGCPTVIAYRVNALTAAIARRLIRVRYASLVNIIEDRAVIPEFIQGDCTADKLQAATASMLTDPTAQAEQREGAEHALRALGKDGPPPAEQAAVVIERFLNGSTGAAR